MAETCCMLGFWRLTTWKCSNSARYCYFCRLFSGSSMWTVQSKFRLSYRSRFSALHAENMPLRMVCLMVGKRLVYSLMGMPVVAFTWISMYELKSMSTTDIILGGLSIISCIPIQLRYNYSSLLRRNFQLQYLIRWIIKKAKDYSTSRTLRNFIRRGAAMGEKGL